MIFEDSAVLNAVIILVLLPPAIFSSILLYKKRQRLQLKKERRKRKAFWSIGYMESETPFNWTPSKAKIVSPKDVDEDMFIIADPFLFEFNAERYLFFEAMKDDAETAYIECAKFNHDQQCWNFLGAVLEEPFHLSYPQVFEHDNQIYMIPESKQARRIGLYKATDFPTRWEYIKPLVADKKLVDSSIIEWNNHWYLFTSRKKKLYLYHADSLLGEWQPHPKSPIRRGNFSRCAGRILKIDKKLHRLAQDQRGYGAGVYAFEIQALSPTLYREIALKNINPILNPGDADWCETGMHHLDLVPTQNGFFGVFDGEHFKLKNPIKSH